MYPPVESYPELSNSNNNAPMLNGAPYYLQLISGCNTQKQFFDVFDKLNIEATPLEIEQLLKRSDITQPIARKWLENSFNLITSEKESVALFNRQRLSQWIDLYTGPEVAHEKSLLIGFTGRNHKISCPIFSLLQVTPIDSYDVLILRDPKKKNFLMGIDGYSNFLNTLLDRLRKEPFFVRYKDTRVIGSSGGGFAALVAGRYLHSRRVLAVSGHLPGRDKTITKLSQKVISAMLKHEHVPSICLFASNNETEMRKSNELALAFGAKSIGVEGTKEHGVLYELLTGAQLRAVLQKLLFSDDLQYAADLEITKGVIKPLWTKKVLEQRVSELETQIKEMRSSISWRLTAPLRRLRSLLRTNFSAVRFAMRSSVKRQGVTPAVEPKTVSGQHILKLPSTIARSQLDLPTTFVQPASDLERRMASLFAAQFNVDFVGANDDFFDLGGDSVAAEDLSLSITGETGYDFEVSQLVKNSTPRLIARLIEGTN